MTLVTNRSRRDSAANWTAANPILSLGEIGWETDGQAGKMGDGTTTWNNLPYSLGKKGGTNVIDVTASPYLAKGDGTTDDTTAIHAARDAAAAVGADLLFPGGKTYLHGNLVANANGQRWIGYGATLKMKTGLSLSTNGLRITGTDVTIEGFTLDGSNYPNLYPATNMDYGVVSAADGTTWQGCHFKSMPGYGVGSINVNRQKVRNCRFTNNAYGATFLSISASGGPTNIYDFEVSGCYVDSSTLGTGSRTNGISLWAPTGSFVNRITVSNNIVLMPASQTFGASGIVGIVNGKDFTIADNVGSGSNIPFSIPNAVNGIISGNVCRGFNIYGIEVPVGPCDNVTVTNNVIDAGGLADTGMSVGGCNALTISNNEFTGFNSTGSKNTILMTSGSTGVVISGNTFRNTANAASRSAVTVNGTISNLAVIGNFFDGGTGTQGLGVQLLAIATGTTVVGNQFSNLTRGCLLIAASSGTFDNVTFVGNGSVNCAATLVNALSGSAVLGANVVSMFNNTLAGNTVGEGWNLSFGTTTGTKIGTSTGQKLAFWNATPVTRRTRAGQFSWSGGTPSTTITAAPASYTQSDESNFRASVGSQFNKIEQILFDLGLAQ